MNGRHCPGLKNKGKRGSKRESLCTPTFKDWDEKDKLAMEAKQERKEKTWKVRKEQNPNEDVVGRQCQVLTTLSSRRAENLICTDSETSSIREKTVERWHSEARAGGLRSEYG